MGIEFTIREIPREVDTRNLPFIGMDQSKVVLDIRSPEIKYFDLIDSLRFFQGPEDYLEITPIDLKKATGDILPELPDTHKYVCNLTM